MIRMEIIGLEELEQRFSKAPEKLDKALTKTMEASLLTLTESVPPYPVRQSDYVRTGTLGRTLGSSVAGGKGDGKPDIFEVSSSRANGARA